MQRTKYSKEGLPDDASITIKPLVLKPFGRWHKEGRKYLQMLAKKSCDEAGQLNSAEFMDFLAQALQCSTVEVQC